MNKPDEWHDWKTFPNGNRVPQFTIGDKVYFYVGKCFVPKEQQIEGTIEVMGLGEIIGYYDIGYSLKIIEIFFIKNRRFYIKKEANLHHCWVEEGEYIYNKFIKDRWSIS